MSLQLALLRSAPGFGQLRDRVKEIAGLLEEKDAIPMVREQMSLIQDVLRRHLDHVVIEKLRKNKPLTATVC